MSSETSSVFAALAYRLATNPDSVAHLRQADGLAMLTDKFPTLSVEEREAVHTVMRQRASLQRVNQNAAASPVDGDWWRIS